MINAPTKSALPPVLELQEQSGARKAVLTGDWNLRGLAIATELCGTIKEHMGDQELQWNLEKINTLDSAGAFILWQAWGEQQPGQLKLRQEHRRLFDRWHQRMIPETTSEECNLSCSFGKQLKSILAGLFNHTLSWLILLGQLVLDFFYLLRNPGKIPWTEISASIYKAGVRALGITALVSFLIGVSLSYLSALQLQKFGAEIYVIDLLGLSIIRELGPVLSAILIAGRSGSAMTAEIGIMRVTQELDALSAMGISHSLRLVLPKVIALGIAMPLLVVWSDILALAGGMISAKFALDISFQQFMMKLPEAVPMVNFYIGLGKGVAFGLIIAMIACHFGFHIKPNTESLGNETTNSVVTSITAVIIIDTMFAILFRNVGFP